MVGSLRLLRMSVVCGQELLQIMNIRVECFQCEPTPTAVENAIAKFLLAHKPATIKNITQSTVTNAYGVRVLITILYTDEI